MRLRNLAIAIALCALACTALAADAPSDAARTAELSNADIERAIEKLSADPNLATERKTRTLKWRTKENESRSEARDSPAWLEWIGEFFSWLGETARVFVWLAAGLLIAILIVWIVRYARGFDRKRADGSSLLAPTHVRDLDIRPESLPDDIGQAALKMWESGEHRAALSLLYRGFLSRLAHKYAAPIRHSSTEGECLGLALQHLPSRCHAYASTLIRTWQAAVYGGVEPREETVRQLCAEFSATFDSEPVMDAGAPMARPA